MNTKHFIILFIRGSVCELKICQDRRRREAQLCGLGHLATVPDYVM
jgi:hypothetical protein